MAFSIASNIGECFWTTTTWLLSWVWQRHVCSELVLSKVVMLVSRACKEACTSVFMMLLLRTLRTVNPTVKPCRWCRIHVVLWKLSCWCCAWFCQGGDLFTFVDAMGLPGQACEMPISQRLSVSIGQSAQNLALSLKKRCGRLLPGPSAVTAVAS